MYTLYTYTVDVVDFTIFMCVDPSKFSAPVATQRRRRRRRQVMQRKWSVSRRGDNDEGNTQHKKKHHLITRTACCLRCCCCWLDGSLVCWLVWCVRRGNAGCSIIRPVANRSLPILCPVCRAAASWWRRKWLPGGVRTRRVVVWRWRWHKKCVYVPVLSLFMGYLWKGRVMSGLEHSKKREIERERVSKKTCRGTHQCWLLLVGKGYPLRVCDFWSYDRVVANAQCAQQGYVRFYMLLKHFTYYMYIRRWCNSRVCERCGNSLSCYCGEVISKAKAPHAYNTKQHRRARQSPVTTRYLCVRVSCLVWFFSWTRFVVHIYVVAFLLRQLCMYLYFADFISVPVWVLVLLFFVWSLWSCGHRHSWYLVICKEFVLAKNRTQMYAEPDTPDWTDCSVNEM